MGKRSIVILPLKAINIMFCLLSLSANGAMLAQNSPTDPFSASNTSDNLPDLGSSLNGNTQDVDQKITNFATSLGKSLQDSDDSTDTGRNVGQWIFNHFRDRVVQHVDNSGERLLSRAGNPAADARRRDGRQPGRRGGLDT